MTGTRVAQLFFTYMSRSRSRSGWTMIELMVVIAIISLLAALAVPAMRMFGKSELRDSARLLSTLLRAARMYAVNYNVETAVVYYLDDPFSVSNDGTLMFSPMEDSVTNQLVRTVVAASIMYRLPANMPAMPLFPDDVEEADAGSSGGIYDYAQAAPWLEAGTFVPTASHGDVVTFPTGYSLLLNAPLESYEQPTGESEASLAAAALGPIVYELDPALAGGYSPEVLDFLMQYNRQMERGFGNEARLEQLGMQPVYVYPETPTEVHVKDPATDTIVLRAEFFPDMIRPHMAHVFTPRGSLKTRKTDLKERYRLMVAPTPDAFMGDRFIFDSSGHVSVVSALVEIQRATGYVRLKQ